MLEVLKIIGIVVLCAVVFSAAVILLVLFFPVRYTLIAKGRNEEIGANGVCKWLFGVAAFYFTIDKDTVVYKLKLFGITFRQGQVNDLTGMGRKGWQALTGQAENEQAKQEALTGQKEKETALTSDRKRKSPDKSFFEKVKEVPETIKKGYEKAASVKRILETRTGKRAFRLVKKRSLELLNLIKPYIIKGQIRYGFDDAALTAMVYGIAGSVAYRLAGSDLEIVPDYLEKGVDLDVEMRGKFKIQPVLAIIFSTISDEGVKRTCRVIKRIIQK